MTANASKPLYGVAGATAQSSGNSLSAHAAPILVPTSTLRYEASDAATDVLKGDHFRLYWPPQRRAFALFAALAPKRHQLNVSIRVFHAEDLHFIRPEF